MKKVRDRETRSPAPETGALPRIGAEIKCLVELPPGILLWRRPIDSLAPAHSPATLAGLTIYLAAPNRSVLLRHTALRRAVLE
jgi:hypothetical protein